MRLKFLKVAAITCIATALCITGCDSSTTNQSKETTNNVVEPESDKKEDHTGENFKISTEDEKIYNELFNLENHISVKVDISDEELAKLQKDYDEYSSRGSKSPIYRRASKVTITIGNEAYEIEDVGIRMKGNTSRSSFYDLSTGEITDLVHWKLKFNETFDDEAYYGNEATVWSDDERKARKKRTFASLESLEIKWNSSLDNTYMRQIYAHYMFRDFSCLAAQCNLSTMAINNDKMGVWVIYEPVDDIFIERNLEGKDWAGDLYKAGWTNKPCDYTQNTSIGIEDEDTGRFFNLDLKTNKKTSTHDQIKNFIRSIGSQNDEENIEKILDTQYFAKFAALSYFTGNPDDYRNNYNNHYIYFLNSTNQAVFIPYDLDRCFGITHDYNPTRDGMMSSLPLSGDALGAGYKQQNPVLNKTILNGSFLEGEYLKQLSLIADSEWLKYEHFVDFYYLVKENYEDEVIPNKDYNNVDNDRLEFSLEGVDNGGSDRNISTMEYMNAILETYKNSLN